MKLVVDDRPGKLDPGATVLNQERDAL